MTDYNRNPTWDVVLYRSTTDAVFRDSLIADPTRVLQDLGLLDPNETVTVLEWKPNERVLILPPLVDASPERVAEMRSGLSRTRRATTLLDTPRRAPYAKDQPSTPIVGPAACALNDPSGISSRSP